MQLKDGLNKDYLSKLKGLVLKTNQILHSGYEGIRKSKSKGTSIEFSDFKNYTKGDNIKHIDWNSYARLDKLYLKLYMEEKQININILMDCSKSMDYGDKIFYSQMIAGSIGYISLNNADRVNIYGMGNRNIRDVNSKSRFNEIVDFLSELEYGIEWDMMSIMNIGKLSRGITVLISDMFINENADEILKYLQYMGQEVLLIHILDRDEIAPVVKGAVKLIDSENDLSKSIEINERVLNDYQKALKKFKMSLNDICRKRNAVYIDVSTEDDILQIMGRML